MLELRAPHATSVLHYSERVALGEVAILVVRRFSALLAHMCVARVVSTNNRNVVALRMRTRFLTLVYRITLHDVIYCFSVGPWNPPVIVLTAMSVHGRACHFNRPDLSTALNAFKTRQNVDMMLYAVARTPNLRWLLTSENAEDVLYIYVPPERHVRYMTLLGVAPPAVLKVMSIDGTLLAAYVGTVFAMLLHEVVYGFVVSPDLEQCVTMYAVAMTGRLMRLSVAQVTDAETALSGFQTHMQMHHCFCRYTRATAGGCFELRVRLPLRELQRVLPVLQLVDAEELYATVLANAVPVVLPAAGQYVASGAAIARLVADAARP